ncbi:hypothetical protein PN498_18210 [Oscillatoria sp. CS-180]|uniref:hypothetical protein n=1 Tax=Oscillatoria sp. CS-180 TaxID=3021720 RepID=UPI00232EA76A|nr:hypothetical protein [Oscillatoria sp. CS-180]MDB9527933.1 hypothetical protein [Oscillatoria sp. CS-180]
MRSPLASSKVFPNEKPYGKSWRGEFYEYNGHRLPLQPHSGSCILDGDLQPCGDTLSLFWAMWDHAVQWNNHDEIADALLVARANRRRRRRAATGPAAQWQADLETIIADGWTGHGQTNQLLKEIATYGRVFEKLSGADLQVYVFTTATSRPGYERWCGHQHEIGRRCDAWALAVEKYYWPLGDEPIRKRKPFKDICRQRADDAKARILEAMRSLRFEAPQMGIKRLANELVAIAKCSLTTLYKYAELWHPHPKPEAQHVTPDGARDTADLATVQRLVRESLESVGIRTVTHKGGGNEVCILKSTHLKNLSPAGEREGYGERKGNSTGSLGWIPNLNWKPGAVGEV